MMRRRVSLLLLAVIVIVLAVALLRYMSIRNQAARRTLAGQSRDTLAQQDSAARAEARRELDTMCVAGRFGLPCDPR